MNFFGKGSLYDNGRLEYKGEFKDGEFDGCGTYWEIDGTSYVANGKESEWVNGILYVNEVVVLDCRMGDADDDDADDDDDDDADTDADADDDDDDADDDADTDADDDDDDDADTDADADDDDADDA